MVFLKIFVCLLFYTYGDIGSGNLNETKKKHLNTMQNHWVVQIRLNMLATCLLRTTPLFIKDHPVFLDYIAIHALENT